MQQGESNGTWRLMGYDAFAGERYELQGSYATEEEAGTAASRYLDKLNQTQPQDQTGGQSECGIQDRIYIVRPDGSEYRY